MANSLSKFSDYKYRWVALIFISLALAIIIIDNSVLNVAIPYILRDLNTSIDALQWVISGYAMIIATLLITMGRLGDIWGRKKVFLLGTILFAIGSFTASIAPNALMLFIGEALIEAIGASMMMTSSLALLAGEFRGRERAIAFGIWGSVAGVAASIGPLLGGYLTTYYSWRWSLRINVFVALITILGSVFIRESKVAGEKGFDFLGTLFSGLGLFLLIFGFIEGSNYGWWETNHPFSVGGFSWPFTHISVIPIAFFLAAVYLALFFIVEYSLEGMGKIPLLRLSIFKNGRFSLSLITLGIVSLGQFGVFFTLPIYLQNALGMNAFKTGLVFLSSSLALLVAGPSSGFISSRIGPKWIVTAGMFSSALGTLILRYSLSVDATGWTMAPGFIFFGMGIGAASAQLTNLVISSLPHELAGEASATNSTIRQVGVSVGVAILGTILASSVISHINTQISSDIQIPAPAKAGIEQRLQSYTPGQGQTASLTSVNPLLQNEIEEDIKQSLTDASKDTLLAAFIPIFLGALLSLFIPNLSHHRAQEPSVVKPEETPQRNSIDFVSK